MKLLPPESLIKTGPVDHADWNYKFLLGLISRRRFELVIHLLTGRRFAKLLEIGYGSGVFLPQLSGFCHGLYGIDQHEHGDAVKEKLANLNTSAELFSCSVVSMPFEDHFFDCIVAVSVLEFIADLDAACREIKRVLTPGGDLIVVTPGHSRVVDFVFKKISGKNPKDDFGNRRESVIPMLMKHFTVRKQRTIPPFLGPHLRLYTGLSLSYDPRSKLACG